MALVQENSGFHLLCFYFTEVLLVLLTFVQALLDDPKMYLEVTFSTSF